MSSTTGNHDGMPARFNGWTALPQAKIALLAVLALLSVPSQFTATPVIGLDYSWQLSLQLAAIQHKIFGQDFVFTYGPLGYLFIRADVNKAVLLLFDLFMMGSLLSIYNKLIPARPRFLDVLPLLGLAVLLRTNIDDPSALALATTPAVLFAILCHWFWRVYERGDGLAVASGLIAALALFFGKVNYGTIMLFLVPAYGIGLLLLRQRCLAQGLVFLFGFPVLVWLGAMLWNVYLPKYMLSGVELIDGYSEAMVMHSTAALFALRLAWVFLAAMGVVAVLGRGRLSWREQVMILPLIGIAVLLLYKNAFVRADGGHYGSFFTALPLLLAVWCVSWVGADMVRVLLVASLFYPLAQLLSDRQIYTPSHLVESLPVRYVQQAISLPWHEDGSYLTRQLRTKNPKSLFPEEVQSRLRGLSVDVMPWESSIAILNGLNYQPRPVPQSYSAYTPWLDALNARFLDSTNAPDCILYLCGTYNAIDVRPAAWDESITKRALLENYKLEGTFALPVPVWPFNRLADICVLKKAPHLRRFVPVQTNEISLMPGQILPIPATTNLIFLTLDVNRSLPGKLWAAVWSPNILTVAFNYENGESKYLRAVLPVLRTGVLVNRKVETAEETCNWLQGAASRNLAVTSICFKTSKPWTFRSPFTGTLVEYEVLEK